jgi:protein gp37
VGADSKIQWTHHTFNPWWGCEKVSPACKNCYAEAFAKRTGHAVWGGDTSPRRFFGGKHWQEPLKWNRAALAAGERHRVFCASMADVFEARYDLDEHRARLWELIEATPALDWLLLTKRPEEVMQRIPERWRGGLPANVWVGTTVENQAMADERIPHLLDVPARVRFLSCEPLLERVNLHRWLCKHATDNQMEQRWMSSWCDPSGSISWVIIGGESGPPARPCALEWICDLVEQCRTADVPRFVKQLGALVVSEERTVEDPAAFGLSSKWAWAAALVDRAGGDPEEWPEELCVREFPAGVVR